MSPPGDLGRRELLAGAGALALATGLGACSGGSSTDGQPTDDATEAGARDDVRQRAVVIGAGLAGLTAALDLAEAGWEVVVLEARDRVGGRVHTVREPFADGLRAEAGGESIDLDHADLLAMVERFGLETEERPPDKILDGVVWFDGERRSTTAFLAEDDGQVAADYERFYEALDELAADVDPERPQDAPDAEALDQRTAAQFLDELDLGAKGRFLAETDVRSAYNARPEDLSLLFLAQQSAAGTDVSDEAVEALRIAGGNDRLPEAMADELGGVATLRLEAPVTAIAERSDEVVVTYEGGEVTGAVCVLACPFPPLRQVAFDPPLPEALAAAVDGLDLGPAAKVTVEYEEPFWSEEGSGFTVADEPFGVAWSPTDSYDAERGLLTAFLTGQAALDAAEQEDDDRTDAVVDQFDDVYPEGEDLRTGATATIAWDDEPFTGGGYAAYAPGQLAPFWPAIRSGTDRLWFAGEHTESLAGYMESAVRSGHRVAADIGEPPG